MLRHQFGNTAHYRFGHLVFAHGGQFGFGFVIDEGDVVGGFAHGFAHQDVFISVAAVADYKVKNSSEQKIKKQAGVAPIIELTENPDILASVSMLDNPPFCVGFAAESHDLLNHARAKRIRKNVPLLVANLVGEAMGKATNHVTLIDDEAETELPAMGKDQVAEAIVSRVAELMP